MVARVTRRCSALAVAVLALGCGPADGTMPAAPPRRFAEVDAADAARQIATGDAWLVQVRDPGGGDPRAAGADVVTSEEPMPASAPGGDRAVFVVGHDDARARRFASRLVRAGFPRVFVIRGGIRDWLASGQPRG